MDRYAGTDLEAERRFYRDVWKLDEVSSDDCMVYFSAAGSPENHVVRLRGYDDNRIDGVTLAAATSHPRA